MIFEPFKPFLASAYQIKFATEGWEQRGAAALRSSIQPVLLPKSVISYRHRKFGQESPSSAAG